MLKAQKDFSINPIDVKGISHFHIACNLCEVAIVKKFLERADLGVNQPIDYFAFSLKCSVAGFTPLHAAIVRDKSCVSVISQLNTVDLLLKHGADPNRQDSSGQTAFQLVQRYEIFERIARHVVDSNVGGYIPLGVLFGGIASADQIGQWLRSGHRYNLFSDISEDGYIGKTYNTMSFKDLQNLLKVTVVNVPDSLKINEMGRTAIHNVVSCEERCYYQPQDDEKMAIVQYATIIELLATTGCDVDTQDNLGRTAFHLAVKFKNSKAILALLMVGADVNIYDGNGKTALDYHTLPFEPWIKCDEDESQWCNVFQILAVHVQRLNICRLDVCPANGSHVTDTLISTMDHEQFHSQLKEIISAMDNQQFYSQLEEITNIKIEPYHLALGSFLSEINVVNDYPTMSQPKKDVIDEFFSQDKISCLREKFGEVAGLLSLQYRKAVMRAPLIEEAVASLNFLANFPVPQICSHIIFRFLSNTVLKSFIASMKSCKGEERVCKTDILEGSLSTNKKLRIE